MTNPQSDLAVSPVVARSPEQLIERLESYYGFECEGGPLKNCVEWQQLKAALVPRPEPPQACPKCGYTIADRTIGCEMCGWIWHADARPEPREPEPELLTVLKDVLAQFDAGMFVRNTDSDGCSDWAIKAAKPLLVLARAKAAVDKADAALRPASAPSQWTCPYCGHVEEKNHENWQRCAADHIDHCPVVVGAASAPSLENQHGSDRVQHDISARSDRGAADVPLSDGGQVAASAPSRPLGAAEQLKYEFDRAERLKKRPKKPRPR